jgi:hypothetical protein
LASFAPWRNHWNFRTNWQFDKWLYLCKVVSFVSTMSCLIVIIFICYQSGGNIAIWGTSLALYCVAFFYILFGITDSVVRTTDERNFEKTQHTKPKIGRLKMAKENCTVIFKNLIRCFTETFKRRTGYKRACISTLIASMCLNLFANGKQIQYLSF